jgi:hypothetical protein
VLELPQVVAPSVVAADPGNDPAIDDSSTASSDQLGSADDYQNRADAGSVAAPRWVPDARMPVAPPIIVAVPSYVRAPVLLPVPMRVPGIPATSPLLTPHPHSGVIIGGWWHHVR